jgi:hypothetical protein
MKPFTLIKHEFGLYKQIMITAILRLQVTIISQKRQNHNYFP